MPRAKTAQTQPSREDAHMTSVARLVTLVAAVDDGADARRMSVSARHEAVLLDGRRFVLLDDRGWSSSLGVVVDEVSDDDSLGEDVPDIWAVTSVEDIEETARCVVGPDEPFDGRSQEDMEADHWGYLSEVLRQQGGCRGRAGAEAATARRRAQRAAAPARRS
jgi:hypothetical protein